MQVKNTERKTLIVIVLTLITMAAEILVGYFTHSMALFADGWHMGTHAFALSITFFTYVLIRKFSDSDKFVFGTGKFSTLSGFASSILLGLTGIFILFESVERLFNPLDIGFNEAIAVAIIGLIVNAACILIMGEGGHHHHGHCHKHHEHEDFNFKAAYMHILADAMTSVFAIAALFAAKYFSWIFLDSLVGFIGGVVICIWAYGLIKSTTAILVDTENKELKTKILEEFKENIEFIYLHIWQTSEDKVSLTAQVKTDLSVNEIKSKMDEIAEFDLINIEKTI